LFGISGLSDFYYSMVNGSLYVVIHTKDFPNGEVSANSFVPLDDLFPAESEINWDKAANKSAAD
jgi:hypothetical protein